MANWRHKLALKDLLSDDEDTETVRRVARAVHERLEAFRLSAYPDDMDLDCISDEFQGLGFVDAQPDVSDFNSAMTDLYDWGDEGHRLWIG